MVYTSKDSIANFIWQQLGAQRFSLATGCNPIAHGKDNGKVYLLMSVGENVRSICRIEVSYDEDSERYGMRFMRRRNGVTSVIANFNDVESGMLHVLFEQETGMTLPKIYA